MLFFHISSKIIFSLAKTFRRYTIFSEENFYALQQRSDFFSKRVKNPYRMSTRLIVRLTCKSFFFFFCSFLQIFFFAEIRFSMFSASYDFFSRFPERTENTDSIITMAAITARIHPICLFSSRHCEIKKRKMAEIQQEAQYRVWKIYVTLSLGRHRGLRVPPFGGDVVGESIEKGWWAGNVGTSDLHALKGTFNLRALNVVCENFSLQCYNLTYFFF